MEQPPDPLARGVTIRLPEPLDKQLREEARAADRPFAQYLRLWIKKMASNVRGEK